MDPGWDLRKFAVSRLEWRELGSFRLGWKKLGGSTLTRWELDYSGWDGVSRLGHFKTGTEEAPWLKAETVGARQLQWEVRCSSAPDWNGECSAAPG